MDPKEFVEQCKNEISDAEHNITYLNSILETQLDLQNSITETYMKKQIEHFKLVLFFNKKMLTEPEDYKSFISLMIKTITKLILTLTELISLFDDEMIDGEYKNSKEIYKSRVKHYNNQLLFFEKINQQL